jgi:hypothetical protein
LIDTVDEFSMSDTMNHFGVLNKRRLICLVAPREHGAWGLLLVPLTTGGVVGLLIGGNALALAALTIAAIALLWLRTPVESWLGTGVIRAQTPGERKAVGIAILALVKIGALALAFLFWNGRNLELIFLGLIAIAAFLAQMLLRKLGYPRMLAQVVGMAGLTVTAPAAYYVVTGRLDRTAWGLWIANFLFAGNQIHFVQLRIHAARISGRAQKFLRGFGFLAGEVALAWALMIAWRFYLLSGFAVLAFFPLLIRGALWFVEGWRPLEVRRLGWTELAHSLVFAVLLVAGFQMSLTTPQ